MTALVHLTLPHVVLLIIAGFVAGAINAIAGGGSLISFPALLSVGYPALNANVTNTVALVPGYVGGSFGYRRELEGQRRRIQLLGSVSLVGGLVGAILLVISPGAVFKEIVPWLIMFACALLAIQPLVTRFVVDQSQGGEAPRALQAVAQFLAAIYGGYFGAGLGVMMLAFLGMFLQDTLQRLNALKGVLSLSVNLISAVFFAIFGPVAWIPVIVMAFASLAGGNVGVMLARRLNATVLRTLVVVFGFAVSIRLLV